MALKKEVIDDRGLKTLYHRITNVVINVDDNKVYINVKSYIEELYRNYEKEYIKYEDEIETKTNRLYTLMEEENKENINEIEVLTDEINTMYSSNKIVEQLTFVKEFKIELEYDENLNYGINEIYDLIKHNELFINSIDC